MITYYLTLSQFFPVTHERAGEPTFFADKFHAAITGNQEYWNKLHTIRANYEFWAKRFEKIDAGEAVLSIREWVGKPYAKGSTQREIDLLTRNDGIGIEKLWFERSNIYCPMIATNKFNYSIVPLHLSNNDGLAFDDWKEWFKGYDLSKPMAIIHFTKFRY